VSRRPTVSDVAELAGVHRSTAARALNPTTSGLLTRETVARVVEAAQRLQYTPNTIARGLRTNRSSTIGVLIPDLTNPLFPPILRGVEEAIMPLGYTALIVNTDNDPERETANFHALLARQVDGLIVATARQRDPMLDEAERRGVAVVLVNRGTGGRRFPLVAGDDREGVRDAVAHLVELGHRRIAHLAGPGDVSTATVRASAFREAVGEHGLTPDAAPIVACRGYTEQGGSDAMQQVVDAHPGTTAVLAGNDLIALGALRTLQARGLRCPQDVSVVGYNDMRFADALSPALTTVRVPHRLLGVEAAHLLLERIGTPGTPPKTLLLPCELVVRASTAAPTS
jgi:LacI family transcriptional regulator